MKKSALLIAALFMLAGCQQAPTKSIEGSADIFDRKAVMLDTRAPLQFESFHIQGTQNLWWEDYVILKDPKRKIRVLDPDLNQTIERLANKGVNPDITVFLLNDKADAVENKKWKWLLSYLGVTHVQLKSVAEMSKSQRGQNNRFALPDPQHSWPLITSEEFQHDLVQRQAPRCFIKWDEKRCL